MLAHLIELAVVRFSKPQLRVGEGTRATHAESLSELVQQLGAYMHSRFRLPHRWHGVFPLHFIFRLRKHDISLGDCDEIQMMTGAITACTHC